MASFALEELGKDIILMKHLHAAEEQLLAWYRIAIRVYERETRLPARQLNPILCPALQSPDDCRRTYTTGVREHTI